jgi:hypothetical protein
MALVNSHPDYLKSPSCFKMYSSFLETMREKDDYWHALPREVARWWRQRTTAPYYSKVCMREGMISITPQVVS